MPNMTGRRGAEEADDRFELKQTKWKNPTHHMQRVELRGDDNRKIVVTWKPGETKEVPSEFDNAIHRVDCGEEHCHKGAGRKGGGWYCTKGHNGTIVGGLAPLLQRVDAEDELDPALDPEAAKTKQAEADMAAAALTSNSAQAALIIAAQRAKGTEPTARDDRREERREEPKADEPKAKDAETKADAKADTKPAMDAPAPTGDVTRPAGRRQ